MRRERANVNLVVLPSPVARAGPKRRPCTSSSYTLSAPPSPSQDSLSSCTCKTKHTSSGHLLLSFLPPPRPSLHSLQTAIKSGRCVAQGQEEVRTLLEHKGNGNVELRRFLGCSVASLRLTASLPLPLPSPALPLPSVCSCGKKLPAELCCLLLGDLAHVRMQKRLQRFGLCFV